MGHEVFYLLPNGAAIVADTGALKNWERHREEREERDRLEREQTEGTAERLRELLRVVPDDEEARSVLALVEQALAGTGR